MEIFVQCLNNKVEIFVQCLNNCDFVTFINFIPRAESCDSSLICTVYQLLYLLIIFFPRARSGDIYYILYSVFIIFVPRVGNSDCSNILYD